MIFKVKKLMISAIALAVAVSITTSGCSSEISDSYSGSNNDFSIDDNIDNNTDDEYFSDNGQSKDFQDTEDNVEDNTEDQANVDEIHVLQTTDTQTTDKTQEPEPVSEPEPIDYSVIRPYEVGQIMILMYHGIVEPSDALTSYQRTIDDFRNDLQALYDRGFRLISLADLINNNITVEAGYTPVVITFDDGLSSSFSLVEDNGELIPTPNCGFDIMQKFYQENPDFGMTATFFINGNTEAFRGDGTFDQRLQYLIDNNCDVGNHTYSHGRLSGFDADELQREIASVDKMIKDALPDYQPLALSYPFGIRPQADLLSLINSGSYDGHEYSYRTALHVGQNGAHAAPNNKNFDPINMPRVRGSNDDPTDLWGFLNRYDENPQSRYISDGDPQTIVVPLEYAQNVDEDSIGDKTLIYY